MDNKEQAKRNLDEMRHQISEIKNSPDAKDHSRELEELENRRSRLAGEIDGLPSNDDSAWERIKSGVKNSMDEIKSELEQFRNRMRR